MNDVMSVMAAAVAIYGVATIMVEYDGPWMIFAHLRGSRIGTLFGCSVCLLPWLTLLFALVLNFNLLQSLATIGLAMILARNV